MQQVSDFDQKYLGALYEAHPEDAWPPEVADVIETTMGASYIPLWIDGSSGDAVLEARMAAIFHEVHEIFKGKQHDYGPGNIAITGEQGVATRANDKLQRLLHLNGEDPTNEPIQDAWLDLCDYGAIGLALHRGWWPEPPKIKRRIIIEDGKAWVESEHGPLDVDLGDLIEKVEKEAFG